MHHPPIRFDNGTFHVKALKNNCSFSDCLINETEDNLIFEWFNHPKKLTIYYDKPSDYADYIQVWGSDMQNQMQEGTLRNLTDLQTLLIWLNK